MSTISRIVSIILSSGLLFLIFELVRRRKLKEKYAALWLLTGFVILILAIFDKLLASLISLVGIKLPINGVLFFGFFFIILINLNFSVAISSLAEQNKKIAQSLALLENTLEEAKRNSNAPTVNRHITGTEKNV